MAGGIDDGLRPAAMTRRGERVLRPVLGSLRERRRAWYLFAILLFWFSGTKHASSRFGVSDSKIPLAVSYPNGYFQHSILVQPRNPDAPLRQRSPPFRANQGHAAMIRRPAIIRPSPCPERSKPRGTRPSMPCTPTTRARSRTTPYVSISAIFPGRGNWCSIRSAGRAARPWPPCWKGGRRSPWTAALPPSSSPKLLPAVDPDEVQRAAEELMAAAGPNSTGFTKPVATAAMALPVRPIPSSASVPAAPIATRRPRWPIALAFAIGLKKTAVCPHCLVRGRVEAIRSRGPRHGGRRRAGRLSLSGRMPPGGGSAAARRRGCEEAALFRPL